jgi:hypothetical protein
MNPSFPIYIVSKGRHESRLTSKTLERLRIPYFIVVEESEFDLYASVIDRKKILILDERFKDEYETCDDYGSTRSKLSGPARNFAWDDSIRRGFAWHWLIDDNIDGFFRLFDNIKTPVGDGTIFRVMEDFVLRYRNVAMAGPNYFMFASRKSKLPPFVLNTRIYSCNLIRNDVPFRWRGRLNEDTILSLDLLKAGWCTVLFNAFLQLKMTTQTLKGGNTEFYRSVGTLEKSKLLVDTHPDVARISYKFNRWHHHVDYRPFRNNRLELREGVKIEPGVNDYGMKVKYIEKERSEDVSSDLDKNP